MIIFLKNKQTLQVDDFYFKCSVGKKGLKKNKFEGDKKTPKGTFEIEYLYYRKDRIKLPKTFLKTIEIKPDMGWSDDINFVFQWRDKCEARVETTPGIRKLLIHGLFVVRYTSNS